MERKKKRDMGVSVNYDMVSFRQSNCHLVVVVVVVVIIVVSIVVITKNR